jgi:50S ribosomal subunit-associated GTPase HflX
MDAPMSPATLIGSGKVEELALLAQERDATVVYFLNDLSLSQVQRLAALTRCSVISFPNLRR